MPRRTLEQFSTITDRAAEIITENAIVEFQPAQNQDLARTFGGIRGAIETAAQANVNALIEESGSQFANVEVEALVAVEALKQVNGLDLTAVLLRAHYIRTIQERNLLANHPAEYTSIDHMARDNGMSSTDLFVTLDMVNVIFPFVQDELGIPVPLFWNNLGKSKIKEILPVLKAIITGEEPSRASTREAVERFVDDVTEIERTADPDVFAQLETDVLQEEQRVVLQEELDQHIRRTAAERLIEQGELAPNIRELRATLRPNPTAALDFLIVDQGNGSKVLVATVSEDQMQVLTNRMDTRAEFLTWQVPHSIHTRVHEGLSYRPIRDIYNLMMA